ncbi:MAG: pyruvate carboxylase subunit B [Dehalococcoidia bacterium]|nr:pyruvate carboxylase subunit B [Dehalococcoidia bacterium]MYD52470.1 pyruvate carboxylase subunit B [Dehalococcoidia bacterium]
MTSSTPIKITDTTFRDAHQSLMATRLRTEDMVPIAERMNAVGFHSMEVWGGATFDSTTRFLGEDPWERLRTFKKLIPDTPLQMLLRGQSLVGYRPYADDVVDAFVHRSTEAGIDVFRVFDALNDPMNLERAAAAVKDSGAHLQLTICYSVTEEGVLGGPIYNLDYYIDKAKELLDLDADSICVKDMAGLLAPYDSFNLFTALKEVVDVPLQLHTHYTSGMASMTVLKAIEAGVDVVDACLAPLALRTAQPAIEPLITSLKGTERETNLELEPLLDLGDYLETITPKYRQHLETPKTSVIDARVLSHQIPGGMTSNLVSQLREADALDKLPKVLEEIPRTRKDLGYPPLVTPMSQMVGSQSVTNVLMGRYATVIEPVREYVLGLYGQSPAPMSDEIREKALTGGDENMTPIVGRPSSWDEPELPEAAAAIADISDDLDDILTYALYPQTGGKWIRIKHGLDPMPDEMKPAPPSEDGARPVAPPAQVQASTKSHRARAFNVFVDGEAFFVEVDPVSSGPSATASMESGASASAGPAPVATDTATVQPGESTVEAPMPGLVLRHEVEVGGTVESGQPVVVLEAMKMQNSLPSPVAGTVRALPFDIGAKVSRGDVLAIITP